MFLAKRDSNQNRKWELYQDKILEDWHRDLSSRIGSTNHAAMHMARLLCILLELNVILKNKNKLQFFKLIRPLLQMNRRRRKH